MPQPKQYQIWAVSAAYTTAHSNAKSLTHLLRPGIKPGCSRILVKFISAEPWRELHKEFIFIILLFIFYFAFASFFKRFFFFFFKIFLVFFFFFFFFFAFAFFFKCFFFFFVKMSKVFFFFFFYFFFSFGRGSIMGWALCTPYLI